MIQAPELHCYDFSFDVFVCICFAFVSYFGAADEMTLGRGGGLVSSQLVQGAGQDGWWLVVGGWWAAFLPYIGRSISLAIRFEIWVWSERRYWLVKRAFQEHGQPCFQRR